MALIDELVTAVASLTGTTFGTNLFAHTLPVTPTVCTAVLLSGGFDGVGNPVRYPTFQILHRNTNVQSGSTFVGSLHAGLRDVWNLLPTIKCRIQALSEVGGMGYVGDARPFWSQNYVLSTTKPY